MSAEVDPYKCEIVKWCQERRAHGGPHRRYLAELLADRAPWR